MAIWIIGVVQIVVALGIYNVWLVRRRQATAWRGGGASTLSNEFAAYGLSPGLMRLVGVLKLTFATMLILGLWMTPLVVPAAVGLALLMVGALAMHLRVHDPLKRSLPAASMLALCILIAALAPRTF